MTDENYGKINDEPNINSDNNTINEDYSKSEFENKNIDLDNNNPQNFNDINLNNDDAQSYKTQESATDFSSNNAQVNSIDDNHADVSPATSSATNQNNNETQNTWQTQTFNSHYNEQNINNTNMNSYYKENYKKVNSKKTDTWKYVLVSLISAILGGAIISVMILVVAPIAQPKLKSMLGISSHDSNITIGSQQGTNEVKKVEIIQTSESAVTSVAEKVGPSVVGIRTSFQSTNAFFGSQSDYGEGSGIVISTDGYILTNHHVIENAINDKARTIKNGSKIQVFLPNKIDEPYTASIKGYDSKTDLAVLKINETNLPAIEFGNSDELKVGEPAIAFGNPGGLEYMGSLTTGVISGLNRTVQLDGGKKIRLIQTDAAINPGNSGGALVNIKGQLIGVNTIKMVATGFEGLGFAIPINDAKKIADELIKNTYISKPYLGITVDNSYTDEVAKANNLPRGVFVLDVEILGAAQKAGIRALDIITKFNNVPVTSYDELEDEKNKFKPGDVVEVEVYRDGKRKTFKVTLGETK